MIKEKYFPEYKIFYDNNIKEWIGLCRTAAGHYAWQVRASTKKEALKLIKSRYEEFINSF